MQSQIQIQNLLHHSQAFISGSKESLIAIDRVRASKRKVRELFSVRTNLVGNAKDGRVHLWSLHIGIALASKEADGRLAASLHSPFFSWWMNTTNGPLAAPTPHLHPSLGIKGTMLACSCKVEKKRWLGKGETGRGRGSCQLLGEGAIHGRRWNESENEFCSPLHLLVGFLLW